MEKATPKQLLFVDAYLTSFNATDAARKAGYKGNAVTLGAVGAENLKKPLIISLLTKRWKQAAAKREKKIINVYEEFVEQLDFAKALRQAAQAYLADANDPLKLSITPKAHEIEVTYFDHNDMEMVNDVMRPKKKSAQLSAILEAIFAQGNLEPDKFKVTTIDIRKFALDAINTTDTCIDKFAKLGGDYTRDKANPADALTIARDLIAMVKSEGGNVDEAVKYSVEKYGVLEADLVG